MRSSHQRHENVGDGRILRHDQAIARTGCNAEQVEIPLTLLAGALAVVRQRRHHRKIEQHFPEVRIDALDGAERIEVARQIGGVSRNERQ